LPPNFSYNRILMHCPLLQKVRPECKRRASSIPPRQRQN
jgi:hypothetical protein